MRYVASTADSTHSIELPENGHSRTVQVNGHGYALTWQPIASESAEGGATRYSLLLGERSFEVFVRVVPDPDGAAERYEVLLDGQPHLVEVRDERAQALAGIAGGSHASGDATLRAPMPGLVTGVLVEEGAAVRRGQTIVVLEAMKMENDLTTPRAGTVKSIRVTKGQAVNQGEALAIIGDVGTAPADEDDE